MEGNYVFERSVLLSFVHKYVKSIERLLLSDVFSWISALLFERCNYIVCMRWTCVGWTIMKMRLLLEACPLCTESHSLSAGFFCSRLFFGNSSTSFWEVYVSCLKYGECSWDNKYSNSKIHLETSPARAIPIGMTHFFFAFVRSFWVIFPRTISEYPIIVFARRIPQDTKYIVFGFSKVCSMFRSFWIFALNICFILLHICHICHGCCIY